MFICRRQPAKRVKLYLSYITYLFLPCDFKDNLSDILVFNLGNVPGFHLITAKVGGIFKLKFHTTYRNMIIYSSRLDTQNPDVTVQRISTFKHVQAHVLIYLWFRNV